MIVHEQSMKTQLIRNGVDAAALVDVGVDSGHTTSLLSTMSGSVELDSGLCRLAHILLAPPELARA